MDVHTQRTQDHTSAPQVPSALAPFRGSRDPHEVLRRPLITEKATRLAELRVYTFEVAPQATKRDVARAIKELYGVDPQKVRIARMAPRQERTARGLRRRRGLKKAYVYLKEGDSITLA